MLHWKIGRRSNSFAAIAAAAMFVAAAGCRPSGSAKTATTAAPSKPSPSATATPFPLSVEFTGANPTLFDEKTGKRIAQVQAAQIGAGPATLRPGSSAGDAIGDILQGTATLYQDGKPAATFTADKLQADRQTRRIVGTGHVTLHSLSPDSPTICADTMTWTYDSNKIEGSGNVLITRLPDLRLPGKRFTADTTIKQFTIFGDHAPATGSF